MLYSFDVGLPWHRGATQSSEQWDHNLVIATTSGMNHTLAPSSQRLHTQLCRTMPVLMIPKKPGGAHSEETRKSYRVDRLDLFVSLLYVCVQVVFRPLS